MNHAITALVRRNDPDRFLTALFAPAEKRSALLTLYAFNHELARAREVVSEPPLALIRLQWWRDVVEGAHRRHEVAEPLLAAIDAGQIVRGDLLPLIDARETEAVTAFATAEEWRGYLFGSAGGLAVAAGRLLGAPDPEKLRPLGAAYGVAGVLSSVAVHLPAACRYARRAWADTGAGHQGSIIRARGCQSTRQRGDCAAATCAIAASNDRRGAARSAGSARSAARSAARDAPRAWRPAGDRDRRSVRSCLTASRSSDSTPHKRISSSGPRAASREIAATAPA